MASVIRGRQARPAGVGWNLVKTVVQVVLFWGFLLFVLPALIYWTEQAVGWDRYRFASSAWRVAGVVTFACAGALGLASAYILVTRGRGTPLPLDSARELVVAGPYRYVRNPMAIEGLTQGVAVGLYMGSPLVITYAVAGIVLWNFIVRPWEEADLEERFGDAYRRYRQRVRCWRPRFPGYDPMREADEPPLAQERTTPPGRHVLLYDGRCQFCTTQARRLIALVPQGAVDAISFHDPGILDRFPGVPYEACMRAMHLVKPDGRVYSGFEAGVQAVATRPALGSVAYAYYLPGIRLCCDAIYALIAANRYRLMRRALASGHCSGGTCALHLSKLKGRDTPSSGSISRRSSG